MDNQPACVWATNKELWDSFLNDPELARALDSAKRGKTVHAKEPGKSDAGQANDLSAVDGEEERQIGARLRAYETPITDEILRQSIR
ncbi:MAG: hypothetical protein AB8B64_11360 [Granulosicoccus sp.]